MSDTGRRRGAGSRATENLEAQSEPEQWDLDGLQQTAAGLRALRREDPDAGVSTWLAEEATVIVASGKAANQAGLG